MGGHDLETPVYDVLKRLVELIAEQENEIREILEVCRRNHENEKLAESRFGKAEGLEEPFEPSQAKQFPVNGPSTGKSAVESFPDSVNGNGQTGKTADRNGVSAEYLSEAEETGSV